MRKISPRVVGSVVLVLGAIVALAAGVLLPMLGGWGAITAEWCGGGASRQAAAPAESGGQPVPAAASPAARLRKAPVAGALAAAARMPASTDMVLVVDNAADLRASPIGDAAVRFLLDATGMAQTRQAWSTLADQLGWSESETFDRLLGRRVVLVARGFSNPDAANWALLSDVSLETDMRLKERLQASQRAIDQGHQILTLEKGRYELTSHRRVRSAREEAADARTVGTEVTGDDVTIVLGPAGRSELFDEMVGVLASGSTDMLAGREVIAAAGSAGPSDVLLLARLGASDQPGDAPGAGAESAAADRWGDFFILSGASTATAGRATARATQAGAADTCEFTSRVIYRKRTRRDAHMAIGVSSDAVFRALAPGSLLTIVQAAPVQEVLGDAARLLDALRDLPLPDPAQPYLGARQVLSLRELPSPARPAPGGEGAQADPGTRLAAVLALETTSTTRLAPLLDASITRFIGASEQRFGITRPPPHDFGGRLPGVTRLLPLDLPEGNPLRLLVADPLTLAWSYPAADWGGGGGGGDGGGGAGAENSEEAPGWWVMSITPSPPGLESLPEDIHNAVAGALIASPSRAQGGQEARWIWLGHLRAAELERRLPGTALVPDIGGFRSAMKRFEHVRIELSINEAGDIQGDLNAKLAPAPAK